MSEALVVRRKGHKRDLGCKIELIHGHESCKKRAVQDHSLFSNWVCTDAF